MKKLLIGIIALTSFSASANECSVNLFKETSEGRELLSEIPQLIRNEIDLQMEKKGFQGNVNLRFKEMGHVLAGGYGWVGPRYYLSIDLKSNTKLIPSDRESKAAGIYSEANPWYVYDSEANVKETHCNLRVFSAKKCMMNVSTKLIVFCVNAIDKEIQLY